MDGLIDIVIESFGLNVESTVKDRSHYIIETENSSYILKKSTAPEKHLVFQHKAKEYLFEKGFPNTDRSVFSHNGLPYIRFNGDLYVLARCYHCKESDFTHTVDVISAAKTLGLLHSLTKDYDFTDPCTIFLPDIIPEFKKGITLLQGIKKMLAGGKGLSDFDFLVAKNYEYYLKRAKTSVSLLQKLNFTTSPPGHSVICHNLTKEENFLTDNGGEPYLIEFSKIAVAHPVFDVYKLIGRVLKSASKRGVPVALPAKQLLDSYLSTGSLDEQDIKALYALLKYPYSFIKSCTNYYNKRRAFIPASIKNRLDLIIENKEAEEEYIEQI